MSHLGSSRTGIVHFSSWVFAAERMAEVDTSASYSTYTSSRRRISTRARITASTNTTAR